MYYIDISYNSLCTFGNNSLIRWKHSLFDGVSTQSSQRNPVFEVVQLVSRAIKSITLSTVQHAKHSSPRSNANRPGQSSATVTRSRSPPATASPQRAQNVHLLPWFWFARAPRPQALVCSTLHASFWINQTKSADVHVRRQSGARLRGPRLESSSRIPKVNFIQKKFKL